MKAFTSALSLTFLLASLAAATPIAAPQNVEVAAATNGTASTCQCEAVICIQSWPEVSQPTLFHDLICPLGSLLQERILSASLWIDQLLTAN
ncbi:hypothetical protein IWZ03DRAFT_6159 [Phyllosticta citriasiana]|uniref:Uncharacterized protein n=1 Tax=Phyllosticta citriasiana TaxID=595635 RepID=A0ABR1KXL4_9PEZI